MTTLYKLTDADGVTGACYGTPTQWGGGGGGVGGEGGGRKTGAESYSAAREGD